MPALPVLFFVFEFCEELRGSLAGEGHEAEAQGVKRHVSGADHRAQELHRRAAEDVPAAGDHLPVSDDAPDLRPLLPAAQGAVGGVKGGQAREDGLHEHIAEVPLLRHAEAAAERLHPLVGQQADLGLLVVVAGDERVPDSRR